MEKKLFVKNSVQQRDVTEKPLEIELDPFFIFLSTMLLYFSWMQLVSLKYTRETPFCFNSKTMIAVDGGRMSTVKRDSLENEKTAIWTRPY
jgi:hypothetical protein